ncbi:CpsD/CapB family tyrosine-protein kinase [Natronospora cellulosivora (SeqCode)]
MLNIFKKKEKLSRQALKSRKNELIVKNNPKSPVAEAYRNIRTNLSFLSPDKPLKTLLFTSSGTAEGKSLTLVNIALSMVQNGKKVIIIDADLRKPMQHKFFEMSNFTGLSSILTGEIELENGLRETGIEGLQLISTGVIPPNPAELLNSRRMEKLLKEAEEVADIILIDSPPVIAVTDAAVLANKVDGVILVIASHQTDKEILIKSQETLERVHANILGVVLNKYPAHEDGKYLHYYYYGHKVKK